jgi:hypothetical protein
MSAMTAVPTEAIVSQLALVATWTHLDDPATDPVQAALEVLESAPAESVVAGVRHAIDAVAADLDLTEQIAFALHLLLTTDQPLGLVAA